MEYREGEPEIPNTPVPCVICGKDLKAAGPGSYNQPSGGTAFTSRGHYGSTVFDPMPGWGGPNVFLELNFCDECLSGLAEKGWVLLVQPEVERPKFQTRPWTGVDDPDAG